MKLKEILKIVRNECFVKEDGFIDRKLLTIPKSCLNAENR